MTSKLMADIHSTKIRSYNMSRIRSKDTKPEILVRKFLFFHGFRFRLYDKSLPGKPDIVLKKYNTVIFIHGCFWHMHKRCKSFQMPATNVNYWYPKLLKNSEKDKAAIKLLKRSKMKVIVVWECELKINKAEKTLNSILTLLRQ